MVLLQQLRGSIFAASSLVLNNLFFFNTEIINAPIRQIGFSRCTCFDSLFSYSQIDPGVKYAEGTKLQMRHNQTQQMKPFIPNTNSEFENCNNIENNEHKI